MNGFEGSFLGDGDRISADTALECGVCWWVYDPACGDNTWQIPAGTPFSELPAHWRCPNCDAAATQFMVLHDGDRDAAPKSRPAIDDNRVQLRHREKQILEAYTAVDARMRDLPVYNPKLQVQVVGLRPWQESLLAILVTPWCMNILKLPGAGERLPIEGTTRDLDFPSGGYSFTSGQVEGLGAIESCSLFSPMEQFDDPEVAREVAAHALEALLQAPEPAPMSRRNFLRGGRQSADDAAR